MKKDEIILWELKAAAKIRNPLMYLYPAMAKEVRICIGLALNGWEILLDRIILYLYDDSISFMALIKSLFYSFIPLL